MSTFAENVMDDLKIAMKAKDSVALTTLRALKTALTNAAIESGNKDNVIEQADALVIVRKQIKQRNDSIEQFENAGLTEYFDELLSVEETGKFKPFTETYTWGAQKMGVFHNECMLIAAHGWDVAGAQWAGWRAAFVNRPGQQPFPLAKQTEIFEDNLLQVAKTLMTYD